MLQQTTVATVIPYFEKFTQRFPDVKTLAQAEEEEVLRFWEGLGYYSRARNIHKAAQVIVASLNGEFPADVQQLMTLPGIGRYTAGAIASFAFDLPAPIVEANTLRLYSRLLAYAQDPRKSLGQKTLWAFARHLLPATKVGDFNQSLMDLGSLVCSPKEPNCVECPLQADCRAFKSGLQHEIPMLEKRPQVTQIVEVSVAVECGGRYLLRQNPEGQWWAGLWDFVRFPFSEIQATLPEQGFESGSTLPLDLLGAIESYVIDTTGLPEVSIDRLVSQIRHSVTRYRIRLQCFVATTNAMTLQEAPIGQQRPAQWVTAAEFDNIPLSMTGRLFARKLQQDIRQLRIL